MQKIGTNKQNAFNLAECLIDRKDKIIYDKEDRYHELKRVERMRKVDKVKSSANISIRFLYE